MLSSLVQLLSSSHIVVSGVVNLCSYVIMLAALFLLFWCFSNSFQAELVLVTSLEDNTVPVFEVYNPENDRVRYKEPNLNAL